MIAYDEGLGQQTANVSSSKVTSRVHAGRFLRGRGRCYMYRVSTNDPFRVWLKFFCPIIWSILMAMIIENMFVKTVCPYGHSKWKGVSEGKTNLFTDFL